MQHNHLATWDEQPIPVMGVGAMPFSWAPVADHDHAVDVLTHAFGLGFTLVNTADIYAPSADTVGHNERLVGDAVRRFGIVTVPVPLGSNQGSPAGTVMEMGSIGTAESESVRSWSRNCPHA